MGRRVSRQDGKVVQVKRQTGVRVSAEHGGGNRITVECRQSGAPLEQRLYRGQHAIESQVEAFVRSVLDDA
jgi:hypothetical protein